MKAEEGFHGKETGHIPAQQDRRNIRRPLGRGVCGDWTGGGDPFCRGFWDSLDADGSWHHGYNAYCAFGKGYVGPEIHLRRRRKRAPSFGGDSVQQRLQELRNLYDRSLITEEEYQEKRREILKEL